MKSQIGGFSLVEVLIGLVVTVLAFLAIMTAFDLIGGISQRSSIISEADRLARMVQATMGQGPLCRRALTSDAANSPVIFDGNSESEVYSIKAISLATPPGPNTIIATVDPDGGTAHKLGNSLTIQRIYLRPAVGIAASNLIFKQGGLDVPYKVFSADLVIEFERTAATLLGGDLRPKVIPVRVAARVSDGVVDECPNVQVHLRDLDCQTNVLPANNLCTPPAPGPICTPIYYLSGFDSLGVPICRCQWSCGAGGFGSGSGSGSGVGPGIVGAGDQGLGE